MEPIRIVKFPSREDVPLEEAQSGRYVFATGSEPDTIFAFDRESAEEQLQRWAEGLELGDHLARAREVIDARPADRSAGVDAAAGRERGERLNARLREFSAEIGIPMEAPEFIEKAHDAHLFDSGIFYQGPYYAPPNWAVTSSCTDLRPHLPLGALSARTFGYSVALFYDQVNYGPTIARRTPTLSAVGRIDIPLFPRPILSVIFS